jgi:hypothetical protein
MWKYCSGTIYRIIVILQPIKLRPILFCILTMDLNPPKLVCKQLPPAPVFHLVFESITKLVGKKG